MKKILIAAAAVLSVGSSAWAADVNEPVSYDWTGFYIGAQIGAAAHESSFTCDGACYDGPYDSSLNSVLAGGYAGFNYQIDRIVLGVEGDVNALFGKESFYNDLWDAIPAGYEISSDYYASIRGRAGFLLTDNLLVFATGGWAFTDYTLNNPGCPDCAAWGNLDLIDGNRDGWVVGGGMEYALSPSVHLKGEYLFSDFGSQNKSYCGDGCTDFDSDLETHQIRVGLSWNFMN